MRWMPRIDAPRPMLSDTLIVAAGNVAVKGAGLLKLMIVARFFGTGDAQDAFLAAFLLPSAFGEMFSAAAGPSLIPAILRLQAAGRSREAHQLYRDTHAFGFFAMLAVAALLALASPLLFDFMTAGFGESKNALTRSLFYWLLPLLPLAGCSVVWRAVLQANHRFALAAVAPTVIPLITLAVLVGGAGRWDIYALAFGSLAGGLVESALLAWGVRRLGYGVLPVWRGNTKGLRDLAPQFAPLLAGALLLGFCPLIDTAMAARLQAGSVSVLHFGIKLAAVIVSIGPAAVGTAALPHLSGIAARGEWRTTRRSLAAYTALLLLVAIPAVALLIVLSEPLVRVAFQKGAFSETSTLAVAHVQRFSLLQIPFAVLSALGFRLAASLRVSELLLPVSAVGLCVTAVGDFVLSRFLGVAGIALAATFMQIAMICTLALVLMRRFRGQGPE